MAAELTEGSLESERGSYEELAAFVIEHQDKVLAVWSSAVEERLNKTGLSRVEVENSIRSFLIHVASKLANSFAAKKSSATEHGEQRHEIGYELAEVVSEYGLLLDAVELVAGEEKFPLSVGGFAALARLIVSGTAHSVLAFVEEERRKNEHHFAFVAHELRTPLQNLNLSLEAVRNGVAFEQMLPPMERAVGTLRTLVDQELARAREDSTVRPVPRREAFDLISLLRQALEDSAAFAKTRSIRLELLGPESMSVRLDQTMTWSIVTNLVRNGIKFSREGGGVSILVSLEDDAAVIEVQDSCGGLSPAVKTKLFDAFVQVGEDRSGFGLGLGITRRACESHGGTLTVENRGAGCVFRAYLPALASSSPMAEP